MSPVPSKFSQAANFIKHSNNLSSAMKQPPLVKPTPAHQQPLSEPVAGAEPIKSNRRSKLDLAIGGMSVLTGGIGLIGHLGKMIAPALSKADHTTSPVTHRTQVNEIIRLLQTGRFRCRHIFDFHFACQPRLSSNRFPRDTNQNELNSQVCK